MIDANLAQRAGIELGKASHIESGQGTEAVANVGHGPIRNREDCVKALDLVADYFRKQERSSPVPLLLDRTKRLMTKDFLEIMQDLAPDGVSQASKVFGTDPKKT